MRPTIARSASVLIKGAIRSSWFIATSSRISLRTSPCGVARQRLDDLQVLGLGRAEEVEQLAVAGAAFDEGVEPGAGAAVRIRHDGDVAHLRMGAQPRRDRRRLADEAHAAALAVGEIECRG